MKPEVNIAALAKKTYLAPAQKNSLQSSVRTLQRMLSGRSTIEGLPAELQGNPMNSGSVDVELAMENLRNDEAALERGTPPEIDMDQRKRLFRTAQSLQEEIKNGMPARSQMERPTPENVDAHMHWERANKTKILAWKQIRRILEPDNPEPNWTNVEMLRSEQPSYVDINAYWQNFPDFEDEVKDELTQIDEETAAMAMGYKMLGWSAKNIQRKLDLTQDQYRKALQLMKPKDQADPEDVEPEAGSAENFDIPAEKPFELQFTKDMPVTDKILHFLSHAEKRLYSKQELADFVGEPTRQTNMALIGLVRQKRVKREDNKGKAMYSWLSIDDLHNNVEESPFRETANV